MYTRFFISQRRKSRFKSVEEEKKQNERVANKCAEGGGQGERVGTSVDRES